MNKKILSTIFFFFLMLPSFGQCVIYTASITSTSSSCNIGSPGTSKLNVVISGGVSPFTVVYRNEITNVQTTVLNYTSNSDIVINDVLTQTTPFTLVSVTASNGCPATLQNPNTSVLFYKVPAIPTANITNASCPNDSNGSIAITNQFYPSSLVFNGVKTTTAATPEDPHVDLGGRLLSNRSRFSAEGWIKFDKTKYRNRMSLFGQNDVVEFGFEGDNLLCYTAGGGTVTSPLANYPSDNAWHHIAAVGNGTSLKLYVDGNEVGSVNRTTSNYGNNTTYSTKIGWGVLDVGGIGFIGEISNVGFWSRALSIDEIKGLASGFTLYNSKQVGLLAGYNFTEGSGTNVAPISSTTPAPSNGVFNGVTLPLWVDQSTYNWTSSVAGFTPSTSKSLTGLRPGVYNLNITVNQGCSRTTPFTVGATNNVTTPATPGAITGDVSQCRSSTARYSIAAVPNAVSYNWTTTGSAGWTITPAANGLSVSVAFSAGATSGNLQVTATNGCGTSTPRVATVTISTVDNTWNGSAWSTASTPSSTLKQRIIFMGNFNQDVDLVACSCLVSGSSAVTISENRTLFVTNDVEVAVGAVLTFENNASLVQENYSPSNVGNIVYKRRTTLINKFDYTYWSSPVFNQILFDVSPNTFFDKFFSFNASTDTWQQESTANPMDVGKGYIIRGPQFFPSPNPPSGYHVAIFKGRPNNGPIGIAIPFLVSQSSNLIGNPYPSAIDADLFLAANNLILDGTLYFWTHNTPPSNAIPGDAIYNYTSNDYASYNGVGGTATLPAYLGGVTPSGKIAAGQAFFATGIAAGTAVFNNGMRVSGGASGQNNSQFFKTSSTKSKETNSVEKHRIWLNLTNTQGAFKQTLLGYVTNATNGLDKAFDGQSFDGNEFIDFYSINDNKNLTIQGRALPFDQNDEVALGYSSTIEGAFSISIDQVDGVLTSEDVFIEDKTTNTIKNLKEGAYNFSTTAGSFNDRFVLRYKDRTLGTDDFDKTENQVLISKDKNELKIKSELESIKRITVFDLLGRKIFDKEAVNSNEFRTSNITLNKQLVVVKVILTNGKVITKKVIY
ncbi:LamG-like jellyroll fold domain-containing protein [Flavobacterium sp. GNP002]